jgi:hypothetical protein
VKIENFKKSKKLNNIMDSKIKEKKITERSEQLVGDGMWTGLSSKVPKAFANLSRDNQKRVSKQFQTLGGSVTTASFLHAETTRDRDGMTGSSAPQRVPQMRREVLEGGGEQTQSEKDALEKGEVLAKRAKKGRMAWSDIALLQKVSQVFKSQEKVGTAPSKVAIQPFMKALVAKFGKKDGKILLGKHRLPPMTRTVGTVTDHEFRTYIRDKCSLGILSINSAKDLYTKMFQVAGQPTGSDDRAEMGITLTFSHEIEANQNSGLYDSVTKQYVKDRNQHKNPTPGMSALDLVALQMDEGGQVFLLKASTDAIARLRTDGGASEKIPPAAFYVNTTHWMQDANVNSTAARKEWTPSKQSLVTYFDTVPTRPYVKAASGNVWVPDCGPPGHGVKWKFPTDGAFIAELSKTPAWVVSTHKRHNGELADWTPTKKDGIPIPALMTDGRGKGRRLVWQQKRWRTMAAYGYRQNPDFYRGEARIYDMHAFPETVKIYNMLKKKLHRDMACEVNIYAHGKANIPLHTDVERRLVVAAREGKGMYMMFVLFKGKIPIDVPYVFNLPASCVYIMSEGCAGWTGLGTANARGDNYRAVHWKHAAGHDMKAMCGKHYKNIKFLVETESTNDVIRTLFS